MVAVGPEGEVVMVVVVVLVCCSFVGGMEGVSFDF